MKRGREMEVSRETHIAAIHLGTREVITNRVRAF